MSLDRSANILVTGATGMVGSALAALLRKNSFENVLTPARRELDLCNPAQVDDYFARFRPRHVFMIAAKVGGIAANEADPIGFMRENVQIEMNLFEACHKYRTKKNLFLGSSCIYPRECPQPIKEEYLLTGPLEPTNEGYALAKIVGIKLAEYYFRKKDLLTICAMPCNIYGTNDYFDLDRAHVLAALVKRFVDARENNLPSVTLWGTGAALREFIHVEDAAQALLLLMENYDGLGIINVGTGKSISIRELAGRVAQSCDFRGEIRWDSTKPDGMPQKRLDISKLTSLGFAPEISLGEGIIRTIEEYKRRYITGRS
ncbi:MAG: GDP-L-fucose synthase [Syntrophobacteraceae bacterium]